MRGGSTEAGEGNFTPAQAQVSSQRKLGPSLPSSRAGVCGDLGPSFRWGDRLWEATRGPAVGIAFGQKRRLHPRMEPYESGGRRTREEETPSALWTETREEVRFNPVSGDAGPREEVSVRRLSDRLNMRASCPSSNAPAGMPAMHHARVRSVGLTHSQIPKPETTRPRSRGEQGLVSVRAEPHTWRGRGRRGGKCPQRQAGYKKGGRRSQSAIADASHATGA